MKKLIFIFFILKIGSAFSQCTVKIDEFTKDTSYQNETTRFAMSKAKENGFHRLYLSGSVNRTNERVYLHLMPQSPVIQTIKDNEKIYIKFVNDSIIDLFNNESNVADFNYGDFTQGTKTTIWSNSLIVYLNEEDVQKVKSIKIKKIKCGYYDYTVDEKDQYILMQQLNCVLNTYRKTSETVK